MALERFLLSAVLALAPLSCLAVSKPNTLPDAENKTLESFATANNDCLEWSDGCAVCLRQAYTFACSLPGIACQAKAIHCRKRRD